MNERHRAPVRLRMAHLGLLLVLVGLALGAWLAAGTRLRAQPAGSDDAPLAVTQPALSVAKDVTPTNEVPYHGVVTYTVVLGNGGPLSDTNVLLTDTLPAGVDFGHWVQQPPGAEVVADELTWQGMVTAGQALTFTFVVSHVGGYGDVVTNTARFSGTLQVGEDSATFTVVRLEPNLVIAKDATPTDNVAYHGVVTYSVVLDNGGPLSDTNVLLTDTLPAGVDFSRWVAQPPGAEVVADELTWSGTITAEEAITFTFVVSHVGDYGDVVTNTARFSGTLQVGEDSATFTVVRLEPALSVAKSATPTNEVPYHGVVTYTVVLGNGGPLSDTNVLLTDTLPAEVDFGRWVQQPPGAEVVADELTWQGAVTAGQALTFTFVVSHVGDYGDVVTNTARFSGTLQAGEDSATFTVADRGIYTTYLPLLICSQTPCYRFFDDQARAIRQTADGGYVVAGLTQSFGACSTNAWVLKLDADGGITWQKTYGGKKGDFAYAIEQTADGGYVMAGSFGIGLGIDAWVLKLNADGNIVWQKTYDETGKTDIAQAIEQTADGGYVVAGHTGDWGEIDFDFWVLKLNADGSVAWRKTYGGAGYDYAYTFQQTADGGYVMAGETGSFGTSLNDVWVLKLNTNGSIAWQKTYGGEHVDRAYAIQQTADGGYVVAGETESFGAGNYDVWVLKLNADENVAWQKTYGGTAHDEAYAIEQTSDGGYVVAGETGSFGAGSHDAWVLKLNADGNVAWQKTYGGAQGDAAYAIQQTGDGGYVVVGHTASFGADDRDIWVFKLDAEGDICEECPLGEDTSVLPVDSNATVADSSATAEDSDVLLADSDVEGEDSDAVVEPICTCPSSFCNRFRYVESR